MSIGLPPTVMPRNGSGKRVYPIKTGKKKDV